MANDDFKYDVFLSHSSKDKDIARAIAERLRSDGLRVWFDEWELRAGDSIPAKIEEGLEASRVLVLCLSAHAFGSDWARLESYTFRFRDTLNKERQPGYASLPACGLGIGHQSILRHARTLEAMRTQGRTQ